MPSGCVTSVITPSYQPLQPCWSILGLFFFLPGCATLCHKQPVVVNTAGTEGAHRQPIDNWEATQKIIANIAWEKKNPKCSQTRKDMFLWKQTVLIPKLIVSPATDNYRGEGELKQCFPLCSVIYLIRKTCSHGTRQVWRMDHLALFWRFKHQRGSGLGPRGCRETSVQGALNGFRCSLPHGTRSHLQSSTAKCAKPAQCWLSRLGKQNTPLARTARGNPSGPLWHPDCETDNGNTDPAIQSAKQPEKSFSFCPTQSEEGATQVIRVRELINV